jgi:hypothetical protein
VESIKQAFAVLCDAAPKVICSPEGRLVFHFFSLWLIALIEDFRDGDPEGFFF